MNGLYWVLSSHIVLFETLTFLPIAHQVFHLSGFMQEGSNRSHFTNQDIKKKSKGPGPGATASKRQSFNLWTFGVYCCITNALTYLSFSHETYLTYIYCHSGSWKGDFCFWNQALSVRHPLGWRSVRPANYNYHIVLTLTRSFPCESSITMWLWAIQIQHAAFMYVINSTIVSGFVVFMSVGFWFYLPFV